MKKRKVAKGISKKIKKRDFKSALILGLIAIILLFSVLGWVVQAVNHENIFLSPAAGLVNDSSATNSTITTDGNWIQKSFSSIKEKTRIIWEPIGTTVVVPLRDKVLYPLFGVRTGTQLAEYFGYFFAIGFLASFFALSLLSLLTKVGIYRGFYFLRIRVFKGSIFPIWRILLVAGLFGFFYAVLINTPIFNRILEILSLSILLNLLGMVSEFVMRVLLLTLSLLIIAFIPEILTDYINERERAKTIKKLHETVRGEAVLQAVGGR